jgi:hypothetical protein
VSFVAFVRNESDQSIQKMIKRVRPNTAISAVISVADSDPKYVSGIQTVTLNYGFGSGSFLFVKDLKKFKKKYQYFIIHNDFLPIIQYRYFFMSFCRILSTFWSQAAFHIVPPFSRGRQKSGTKSTA